MSIIVTYANSKKIVWENKDQASSFIKRNLRPAGLLVGYPLDRIIKTMNWIKGNVDFKWTLETVGKYIDEDNIKHYNPNSEPTFHGN